MKRLQGLKRDLTTLVRRYNCVRSRRENHEESDARQLKLAFDPLIQAARDKIQIAENMHLDGCVLPRTATGIRIEGRQDVSLFAAGRLWRSRARDIWLAPQFGL